MQNQYIKTIYVGLVEKKTFKQISQELFKQTINQKKQHKTTSDTLLKTALEQYKQIEKLINVKAIEHAKRRYNLMNNGGLIAASIIAFGNLKLEPFVQAINSDLRKLESDEKEQVIKSTLEKNRALVKPKIFYLASEHNDSALDHKDWQGKIYIDKEWRKLITDKESIEKVENYLHNNTIYFFQWVIDKPVYFITRPNCRHYFKSLTIDEVVGSQTNKLVEKYKMHHEIGKRQYVQTLNHKVSREWYADKRNAELLLTQYKNRLRIHKMLRKEYNNELIERAIAKDYLLIAKWTKYLRTLK